MIYLLDTNAVVAILRNRPTLVREHLRQAKLGGADLAVSAITLFELWYGVARSQHRDQNAERLRLFLSGDIGVVPFEEKMAPLRASCVRRSRRPGRRSALTTS